MPFSRLDPKQHGWLNAAGPARITKALAAGGGTARFVGGCVRDALLGRAVGEIDFAADLPPEKTAELLEAAGIKVAPTGIAHGTVTAVVDHKGYEITSLRHDVETDGRHARVAFTDDWKADAARRDFTINAVYADSDGTLHDYFGGQEDIKAGRVRFIGVAQDRIREDVLRILRFFRFTAYFAKGAPDQDGLAACRELALLLPKLSAERVWKETCKLLDAKNPAPVWKLMIANGIVPHVLPEATNGGRLEKLLAAEGKFEAVASPVARLAALLPQDAAVARAVAQKLRLSNREAEKLASLAALPAQLRGKLDPVPLRRALYASGAEECREAALLLAADSPGLDLEPALAVIGAWERPLFPLQGEDILKLGLKPGPKVGEILRAVEEWWMLQDFRPAAAECLAEAKKRAA